MHEITKLEAVRHARDSSERMAWLASAYKDAALKMKDLKVNRLYEVTVRWVDRSKEERVVRHVVILKRFEYLVLSFMVLCSEGRFDFGSDEKPEWSMEVVPTSESGIESRTTWEAKEISSSDLPLYVAFKVVTPLYGVYLNRG